MLRRAALPALAAALLFAATASGLTHTTFGRVTFHRYQRSQLEMRGTVLDGFGRPQAGATVTVVAYPYGGGTTFSYARRTDGRGRYSIYVPRGPSRVVFTYAGGSTVETREVVFPGLWVHARSVGGGAMVFTGGLLVDPAYPLPAVLLQDRTPTGWQTFGAVAPSPRSRRWRFVYRAPGGARGYRFAFRCVSLGTLQWASATSRVTWATVR